MDCHFSLQGGFRSSGPQFQRTAEMIHFATQDDVKTFWTRLPVETGSTDQPINQGRIRIGISVVLTLTLSVVAPHPVSRNKQHTENFRQTTPSRSSRWDGNVTTVLNLVESTCQDGIVVSWAIGLAGPGQASCDLGPVRSDGVSQGRRVFRLAGVNAEARHNGIISFDIAILRHMHYHSILQYPDGEAAEKHHFPGRDYSIPQKITTAHTSTPASTKITKIMATKKRSAHRPMICTSHRAPCWGNGVAILSGCAATTRHTSNAVASRRRGTRPRPQS